MFELCLNKAHANPGTNLAVLYCTSDFCMSLFFYEFVLTVRHPWSLSESAVILWAARESFIVELNAFKLNSAEDFLLSYP